MPALTSAQRQARRLALLNDKCTAAGWKSWRELVTAIIHSAVTVPRKGARKMSAKRITADIAAERGVILPDGVSAEQHARDILERAGVKDAQDMTSGDLVEIANLIAGV